MLWNFFFLELFISSIEIIDFSYSLKDKNLSQGNKAAVANKIIVSKPLIFIHVTAFTSGLLSCL